MRLPFIRSVLSRIAAGHSSVRYDVPLEGEASLKRAATEREQSRRSDARRLSRRFVVFGSLSFVLAGCASWPAVTHPPQLHNPFPQLERIAVMPFFNQSNAPTLDGFEVAVAYQTELQKIPGFQVMPVGVVEQYLKDGQFSLDPTTDFQALARDLGVDVLVVGAITDYDPYTPPRIGLAIDWYAANPGFHPIPVGYGLPWGTPEEEFLPDALVRETEFELAQQQLQTQTPSDEVEPGEYPVPGLPSDWPDPQGLVPPEPLAGRPPSRPYHGPIMELVRQYDAADDDVLAKLQVYDSWQPEARPGGWKGRLKRSEDFTRFCCHMHIAEMLAARGGVDRSSLVFRVPGGR